MVLYFHNRDFFLHVCFRGLFPNSTDTVQQDFDGDFDKNMRVQMSVKTWQRFKFQICLSGLIFLLLNRSGMSGVNLFLKTANF